MPRTFKNLHPISSSRGCVIKANNYRSSFARELNQDYNRIRGIRIQILFDFSAVRPIKTKRKNISLIDAIVAPNGMRRKILRLYKSCKANPQIVRMPYHRVCAWMSSHIRCLFNPQACWPWVDVRPIRASLSGPCAPIGFNGVNTAGCVLLSEANQKNPAGPNHGCGGIELIDRKK